MDQSTQYRLRFTDPDGVPQSLRFKNESQARRFLERLLSERPGTRFTLERRVAHIGPWERVEHGGAR